MLPGTNITFSVLEFVSMPGLMQYLLLQKFAESFFCLTLSVCFFTIVLLLQKDNKLPRYLLITTLLLTTCWFFAPFSENMSTCFYLFCGHYYAIVVLCSVVNHWGAGFIRMAVCVFYLFSLVFFFYIVGFMLHDWVEHLVSALRFSYHSMHSYAQYSVSSEICGELSLLATTAFIHWETYFDLNTVLLCFALIFIGYCLVLFNPSLVEEQQFEQLQYSFAFLILVLLVHYKPLIHASCEGPDKVVDAVVPPDSYFYPAGTNETLVNVKTAAKTFIEVTKGVNPDDVTSIVKGGGRCDQKGRSQRSGDCNENG